MSAHYKVSLAKLIKEFDLETIYLPDSAEDIELSTPDVNRPGLNFSGFYEYFEPNRIQITGKMEFSYLDNLDAETRIERINLLFSKGIPALVVTYNLDIFPEMIRAAETHKIPLLRTSEGTSAFMSGLIRYLSVELAPRITRHGVLVEVYGEGMLLLGDSGVGKSETAIELVKRGHRLIADDAVEIRQVSNKTLVGSSPENIRHYVELRGVGIINARRLFGMGAVKITEKIDMIVHIEQWDANKAYDRMGLETELSNVLGVNITSLTIPVKPGRNLAVILEVAAMNNRQKKLGYNAAKELLENLGFSDEINDTVDIKKWEFY